MADHKKVLASIAVATNPAKLRNLRENAQRLGVSKVEEVAFRRLVEILPEEAPGSIGHDFWKTIHAFEEILRDERGKTAVAASHRIEV